MVKKDKKEFEPVGERTFEGLQCFYCRRLESEENISKNKSGKYACDDCYDPADPEQNITENLESSELQKERKRKRNRKK